MPARITRGLVHVSRAPTLAGGYLPIRILRMTQEHAKWWDEHVQKEWIDSLDRADKNWNWPFRIFNVTRLTAETLGQMPAALVAGVECTSPPHVMPCVMSLLVEKYPDLHDHSRESAFLWYLSPAPDQFFLEGRGRALSAIPQRRALMRIGMDMAITASYNAMRRGRLGLHADPRGGEALARWYRGPEGRMSNLPATQPLPVGLRRIIMRNDGRYFYHDENSAFAISRELDTLR